MKIRNIFLLIFCLVVFVHCNDYEEYFDEPAWLEKNVYQILQDEGNFTSYLQCVDRTNYAPVLKEGGLYTVFAPNNEAFASYLQKKGYASVADIPQEEANTIVAYSMVFSTWKFSNLGDYYNGTAELEYLTGESFKKKTTYYPTIYQDPDYNNEWVLDQNIAGGYSYNGTTGKLASSYKYLPVFMDSYFSRAGLTADDYNAFFPNTPYTGHNLADGQIVINPDHPEGIVARNGIIHEVDVVNYPLDNMEKILTDPQYSVFKDELIDYKTVAGDFVFKIYWEGLQVVQEYYRNTYPDKNINRVSVKYYQQLAFSPAYELPGETAVSELTGFTLFVPSNDVLRNYIDNKLLKYYSDIKDAPLEAVYTLINSHMADGMIYPSDFKGAKMSTGEYLNGEGPRGEGYADFGVIDRKFASNGLIYTINHVIKSKLFETLYSEIFLNPTFSWLDKLFVKYYGTSVREDLMKSIISGYENDRYTALAISNQQFKDDGYSINETDPSNPSFSNGNVLSGTAEDRLKRLLRMHIFPGYKNATVDTEVKSFAGDGPTQYQGWGFRTTLYGDLVRFKDNKLQATGNIEDGTYVTVTPVETYDNGTVYAIDNEILQYSPVRTYPTEADGWTSGTLWKHLYQDSIDNANVRDFVAYVRAALKAADSDELSGINEESFYTILMPNQTAMNNARLTKVRDDDPATTDVNETQYLLPKLADVIANANGEKDIAADFLRMHFLQGQVIADDGLPYLYPYNKDMPDRIQLSTMFKVNREKLGLINQRTYVHITKNANGVLVFTPQAVYDQSGTVKLIENSFGRTFTGVTRGQISGKPDNFRSNRAAGRAVLHEITGFFGFAVNE
jgi:uncharacterized surface protein with fasciclin (FAS1) repeats